MTLCNRKGEEGGRGGRRRGARVFCDVGRRGGRRGSRLCAGKVKEEVAEEDGEGRGGREGRRGGRKKRERTWRRRKERDVQVLCMGSSGRMLSRRKIGRCGTRRAEEQLLVRGRERAVESVRLGGESVMREQWQAFPSKFPPDLGKTILRGKVMQEHNLSSGGPTELARNQCVTGLNNLNLF